MKLHLSILLLILLSASSQAQFLKLQSKDSLDGKPKRQFYTTAWVKMNGIWDYMGIPNTAAMSPTDIPTDGRAPDSHLTMDMYQTRIILASAFQTELFGEIFSYIETDFYGADGGGLRMRHAYIRFKNLRIGQTWSCFTDEESWPNVTDFDGPTSGSWVRQVQLGYFIRPSETTDILIAVESPYTDYNRYLVLDSTIQQAQQTYPDLHTHFEQRWRNGHVQIAGVYRFIEYSNDQNSNRVIPGYGLNLSLAQTVLKRDRAIGQLVVGKGISRYLVGLGGRGWDAAPDFDGNIIALPIWGGYLSYQHYWGKSDFSSTIVAGYTAVANPLNVPAPYLYQGVSGSANVYWQPVGPLNFAFEVIYGSREDELERSGNNYRLQFVFEYAF